MGSRLRGDEARTRMTKPMFQKAALIGIGLIGSSLSHAIPRGGPADTIPACARTGATRTTARKLGLADEIFEHAGDAVRGADLVILCTPVGTFGALAAEIAPHPQ